MKKSILLASVLFCATVFSQNKTELPKDNHTSVNLALGISKWPEGTKIPPVMLSYQKAKNNWYYEVGVLGSASSSSVSGINVSASSYGAFAGGGYNLGYWLINVTSKSTSKQIAKEKLNNNFIPIFSIGIYGNYASTKVTSNSSYIPNSTSGDFNGMGIIRGGGYFGKFGAYYQGVFNFKGGGNGDYIGVSYQF